MQMKLTVCDGSVLCYYNEWTWSSSPRVNCHQPSESGYSMFLQCFDVRKWVIEHGVFHKVESMRHFDGIKHQTLIRVWHEPTPNFLSVSTHLCPVKGALASSSLLTCVMIEEDGWSMRSVKPVKSQLKRVSVLKSFGCLRLNWTKRKEKKHPANALKNPKDFYRLRTFICEHHTRLNVISMLL